MKRLMENVLVKLKFWHPSKSVYEFRPILCEMCRKTELTTDNVRVVPDDDGAYAKFICDSPACWARYILKIGNGGIRLVEADPSHTADIIEIFEHRKRVCVVVKASNVHRLIAPKGFYHNGYVSVRPVNHGVEYSKLDRKIKSVELTYSGCLGKIVALPVYLADTWFVGFDTVHYWNSKYPSSQTAKAAKAVAIKLANEMIRKRI